MQPMNYMIDVKNPFQIALSGAEAGLGISNAMDKAAQQQQQLQTQKQMQSDLGALASKPNPTAQDFAQITTKYPSLAEHFKNTWTMLNSDQQQTRLSQASQIFAALNAGQPEIASKLAADQATAFKNSGQDKDAQAMDTLSQLITKSPETAKTSTGLLLSSVLGPEKFATTYSTLAKLPSEVATGEATARQKTYEANNTPQRLELENRFKGSEIRNLDSQIGDRAARLALDRDKLQTETELKLYELNQKGTTLEGDARKLVNDSVVGSVAAEQAAGQMNDLADRLQKQGTGYGAFSTASEWFKQATGNQNYMTELRNEYARIKNGQAIKMLPPGSASDKDIQIAMKGFPPDTADTATMASFMRGMAKLNQLQSVTENAKAEWVNSVGHLGKPKTDITIDGIAVPAGSTFTDFASGYLSKKVEQKQTQAQQQAVPNRSYMRWANPQGGGALGSGTYQGQ